MSSQIGVRAEAFLNSSAAFGSAVEFTVSAGESHRFFIVQANHPALNSTNIPDATFIVGSGEVVGRARFSPVAEDPTVPLASGGYPDITMLSYWGAVVIEGTFTGFAVTFIGDLHDSSAHPGMQSGAFPSGVN
jgi:hypothetical protein